MKFIQGESDEARFEILQKAAADYLSRCPQDGETSEAIAEQYRKAYAGGSSLGPEFDGWGEQGVWSEDGS